MSLTDLTGEELQILADNVSAITSVYNHTFPTVSGQSYTISDSISRPSTLTIGNTTLTEPELIALKELLKSSHPELYI